MRNIPMSDIVAFPVNITTPNGHHIQSVYLSSFDGGGFELTLVGTAKNAKKPYDQIILSIGENGLANVISNTIIVQAFIGNEYLPISLQL